MAETPEIQAEQAGAIVVVEQVTSNIEVPQAQVMALYNVPADTIASQYAGINVIYDDQADIKATQATVMVVARGLIANPKLIAWWYTLDGHDYYVLKLGTSGKTLTFDLTTGQWAWWASPQSARWRASCGMNWRSSDTIPTYFGSNVIVGDDSFGVLWTLDPNKSTDDSLLSSGNAIPFSREATGQMVVRGHKTMPVFSVQLNGSFGKPDVTPNTIKLSYSDDTGITYVDADVIEATTDGDYSQYVEWRGLGVARQPGRLFKITDEGALARIDSMSVNDGSE